MTTLELKKSIILRIAQINDPELLSAIKTLLDTMRIDEPFITSDEQKKRIYKSLEQVEQGNTLSNENLVKEMNEWFGKK